MDRKIERIKAAGKALAGVFTALAVCLALLMTGARLAGLRPYVVLSGSMEPVYPVGALIYVGKVEAHAIRPGMAITYQLNEHTVVTHRVTRVEEDPNDPSLLYFATRGDANEAEDGTMIRSDQVIGVPVFRLPLMGYPARFLSTLRGKLIALAAGALLLAVWIILHWQRLQQSHRENQQQPTASR